MPIKEGTIKFEEFTHTDESIWAGATLVYAPGDIRRQVVAEGDQKTPGIFRWLRNIDPDELEKDFYINHCIYKAKKGDILLDSITVGPRVDLKKREVLPTGVAFWVKLRIPLSRQQKSD